MIKWLKNCLKKAIPSYVNLCREVQEIKNLIKNTVNEPDNKIDILTNYNIVNSIWGALSPMESLAKI